MKYHINFKFAITHYEFCIQLGQQESLLQFHILSIVNYIELEIVVLKDKFHFCEYEVVSDVTWDLFRVSF